jgi:NTE family protein
MRGGQPRRGLVLGAGGVLGFAWTIGALKAVQDAEGWDPRTADVLVGTSAGSVMAAMLGAGVGVESIINHQRGVPGEDDPAIDYDYDSDGGGALPPRPEWRMGSRALLLRAAAHPRRYPPMAALASMLPLGRGTLEPIAAMIDQLVPPGEWAPHRATWVVAMDYDSGRRTVFGRAGSPPASLSEAVSASCAIPAWYAPVRIGDRRYVDGGTCSPTSLDLLAGLQLEEVTVLSPMTSFTYDEPVTVVGRLERRLRRVVTKRLLHEADKVRAGGTRVTLLAPGREDLQAFGANLMDPRRRLQVLETSLRTSTDALLQGGGGLAVAG